jgi:L-ascorbate metabolism protein UlaG (beta-lactamase superfamily)
MCSAVSLGCCAVLLIASFQLSPSAHLDDYQQHFLTPSRHAPQHGSIVVSSLGTTTLLFDDGVTQLMIDGFITRPSLKHLMFPIETDASVIERKLPQSRIPRLNALFVSHSHYDHVLDAPYLVRRSPGSKLYGSSSTKMVGLGSGLGEDQLQTFAAGAEYCVGDFSVKVLSSKHSPAAWFNDDLGETIPHHLEQPAYYSKFAEGGTFDFLITHRSRRILVKASANFADENELTPDESDVDVLFLATRASVVRARGFKINCMMKSSESSILSWSYLFTGTTFSALQRMALSLQCGS